MLQPSEEIKSRLDIVEVIREYVSLRPAGVNFRTNCPFHREKTPSFIVSSEKQIWHCFGCGRGGDVFTFVMEMEGLSFVEALRQLAPKAGVELKHIRPEDHETVSKRNRLLDAMKLAVLFYHKVLLEAPAAQPAREYLARRGWSEATIKHWQLGASPDSWDTLLNFLKSRGFTEEEIFLAGLSVRREGSSGFYDRFRGRIMFPIFDPAGHAVAFSARVSPEREAGEVMGKYINSPQTAIYDKGKILFGLDKAKSEIKHQDQAIVVEGQADLITAHQAGYANVVATSGTALTADQVRLLKRFSGKLAFAFDMDAAGEAAVARATREALAAELQVKVIRLPSGKDPDECIKKNPEEWRAAVERALPVMEYHFEKTLSGLNPGQVEDKRTAAKILLPLIAILGNKIEQDGWLKRLSQAIDISENILREMLAAAIRTASPRRPETENATESLRTPPAQLTREELLAQLTLALLLKFPEHLAYVMNNLLPDQMVGDDNIALYRQLVIYYNNVADKQAELAVADEGAAEDHGANLSIDYKEFRKWLSEQVGEPFLAFEKANAASADELLPNLLDRLSLLAEKDFYDHDSAAAKQEIIKAVAALKKFYYARRLKEIERQIAAFEQSGEQDKVKILLAEFKALTEEARQN